MAEKVAKLGIGREKDFMYYVKDGGVWKVQRKQPGVPKGRPEKVADGGFEMDTNYIYFVDRDGDVARAKRAVGGQKRKKAAARSAPRRRPPRKPKPRRKAKGKARRRPPPREGQRRRARSGASSNSARSVQRKAAARLRRAAFFILANDSSAFADREARRRNAGCVLQRRATRVRGAGVVAAPAWRDGVPALPRAGVGARPRRDLVRRRGYPKRYRIQTKPTSVATDMNMYCSSSHCDIFRFAQRPGVGQVLGRRPVDEARERRDAEQDRARLLSLPVEERRPRTGTSSSNR